MNLVDKEEIDEYIAQEMKKAERSITKYVLGLMVIMFVMGFASSQLYNIFERNHMLPDVLSDINLSAPVSLQDILYKETFNFSITNGTCLDYAKHFNTTLSLYPELDIRWDRYMCLDDVRNCTSSHTYLVVGGHNSLCMINSKRYDCINFEQ